MPVVVKVEDDRGWPLPPYHLRSHTFYNARTGWWANKQYEEYLIEYFEQQLVLTQQFAGMRYQYAVLRVVVDLLARAFDDGRSITSCTRTGFATWEVECRDHEGADRWVVSSTYSLQESVYYVLRAHPPRRWLSFFHVWGQAGLRGDDVQMHALEQVVLEDPNLQTRKTKDGTLYLRAREGVWL